MVKNALLSEQNCGDMVVDDKLSDEFSSVNELRLALLSSTFRTYPKTYDLFCRGWESGKMRGTKKRAPGPLERVLTISHEANFRFELAQSISVQGYRHSYSSEAVRERAKTFKELIYTVKKDRDENGKPAWEDRKNNIGADPEEETDDEHEEATDHGGVRIDESLF